MSPGRAWLKTKPPKRLGKMNKDHGTTALYEELRQVLVTQGGGNQVCGWQSKKIDKIIERYQPRFNEHGVSISYSKVQWQVSNGQSSHTEYRYWLEFAPAAVLADSALGVWELDRKQAKDARRVEKFLVTITNCYDVFHVTMKATSHAPMLNFIKFNYDIYRPVTHLAGTTFEVRHLGKTFHFSLLSSPQQDKHLLRLTCPSNIASDPILLKRNAKKSRHILSQTTAEIPLATAVVDTVDGDTPVHAVAVPL